MKKYILTLIVMITAIQGIVAQQIPLFSQYHLNRFIYNPAFVGAYTRPQVYFMNRNQWTGIPDAPVTQVISFETSLNKDIVGLGGYLTQDVIGVFRNINGQLDYSYKVKLADSTNVYFGLGAGFTSMQIDFNKLRMRDGADPLLLGQPANRLGFDAIGGVVFNWKRLNIGLSVPQLFNTSSKFNISSQNASVLYRSVRHFVGSVDYNFPLKNGFSIKPIYVIKKGGASIPFQHELTAVGTYKNNYWASIGYRTSYGITAGLGLRIYDQLSLGYAFDFSTSDIKNYAGQTHEVIVGFRFGKELEKVKTRINKLDSANIRQDSALYSLDTTVKKLMKNDSIQDTLMKKNFAVMASEIKKARVEMLDSVYHHKFRVGERFTLTRVYYRSANYDLLPGSITELNDLISVLNRYPMLEIEVIGYTDAIAGEEYNLILSRNRAKAVYDYLVANGISKDRLKYRGAGKSEYVADNNLEAGRQLNRRVEFRISKM